MSKRKALAERARILAMLKREAEHGPVGSTTAYRYAIWLIEPCEGEAE